MDSERNIHVKLAQWTPSTNHCAYFVGRNGPNRQTSVDKKINTFCWSYPMDSFHVHWTHGTLKYQKILGQNFYLETTKGAFTYDVSKILANFIPPPPCQQLSALSDPPPLMTSAFTRPPPPPPHFKVT